MCGGNSHAVYSALVQQYLFVSLHQAMLESMLSENIARLAAMQTAERNIEDRCAALQFEYHQSRQSAITGELLEIRSGFEALTRPKAALPLHRDSAPAMVSISRRKMPACRMRSTICTTRPCRAFSSAEIVTNARSASAMDSSRRFTSSSVAT